MIVRVVIGCVVACTAALGVRADEPKEKKLRPTVVFSGTHSAIRYETFNVIATEEGWQGLWRAHRGDEHDPLFTETGQSFEIDFEMHYVVVVFVGGYEGCEITPQQRGSVVVIGFKGWFFQTEGRPPRTAEDTLPRTPDLREVHREAKAKARGAYAFVVLPKPVRTVVIEQNVQRQLGEPPVWQERFLFPAPNGTR